MTKKYYLFLFILIFFLIGIFGLTIFLNDNTHDYNLNEILQPPSSSHIMGTDNMGRDLFIRLIYGSRNTIILALVISIINIFSGFVIGMIAGYMGGIIDTIFMRIVEALLSLPSFLIAVCLLGVFGGGIINLILFLTITGWCSLSRLVRNEVLIVKNQEFIVVNKVFGYSIFRNLFYHIMPNVFLTLIFYFIAIFIGEIYAIVSINFLGLGLTADIPDLGMIISDARLYLLSKPYLLIFPVMLIFTLTVSLHVLADEVRDYFDKKKNLINFAEYASVSSIKENYENE